jgi:hypothetical protein
LDSFFQRNLSKELPTKQKPNITGLPPLNLYYTPSQPEVDDKVISPVKENPQQSNLPASGNLSSSSNKTATASPLLSK